jgi:phosphatidylserine/phosphatidylglycerophosphate/cardiolipin synthase-like enzyme
MRQLVMNSNDDFRVKGYAGTNSVLLAIDLDQSRKNDLMGFAIEKKEGNYKWQWLLNSLTFPGKQHTIPAWGATPSNLAPLQKFRWADYSLEPGLTCKYKVHLVYGSGLTREEMLEVELKTDDGKPKDQHVNFNRAVAASQAFGRKFSDLDVQLSLHKNLAIEQWPAEARAWLENGLLEAILNFISQAADETWALDVAIYEYELQAIVEAVYAAFDRKVDIRVLYHAKKNDEQTEINEHNLTRLPAECKKARVTHRIFHDKFIVLSKLDAAGQREPQAVLCGSTNFTENGVYRQANVVHVSENKALAENYETVFNLLWEHPDEVGVSRKWITDNNVITEDQPLFAGFSPRSKQTDLDAFVKIIQDAKKDLLFATAFKLPERILDALLGLPNDPVLRFGIQNTASRITGFHADRTAEFATPALLKSGLEGWIKEGLRGQRGNLLVHTKAVVTDFTTDHPVVLSGSHNLSVPASNGNDENYLIIRGDTDVADRYGLEILRFYEHYRFRYYARLLALKQANPLAVDDKWTLPYYKTGHLKALSRIRFSGR